MIKEIFFGKEYLEEINFYRQLGYNQEKLPNSQFENFVFERFQLENIEKTSTHYNAIKGKKSKVKRFFLEDVENGILVTSPKGKFLLAKNYDLNSFKEIKNNLIEFNIINITDTKKINNDIFISFAYKKKPSDDCSYIAIAYSSLEGDKLDFDYFYKDDECTYATNTLGGRIFPYSHNNIEGFLITTGAADKEKNFAQDLNSFFGKIWFFSLEDKKKILFSKGHRNPQGLVVSNNIVLATEHGPYGGDEINNIKFGSNYGFPISSYGEPYSFKKKKSKRPNYVLKKDHSELNFVEPIFSFVPSIGISEIEKIPDIFTKYWKNNFLITSLNARKIYRIKFDKKYSKIIYMEPMFLGERIRDIRYIKAKNYIALALEETGSIGILKVKEWKKPI